MVPVPDAGFTSTLPSPRSGCGSGGGSDATCFASPSPAPPLDLPGALQVRAARAYSQRPAATAAHAIVAHQHRPRPPPPLLPAHPRPHNVSDLRGIEKPTYASTAMRFVRGSIDNPRCPWPAPFSPTSLAIRHRAAQRLGSIPRATQHQKRALGQTPPLPLRACAGAMWAAQMGVHSDDVWTRAVRGPLEYGSNENRYTITRMMTIMMDRWCVQRRKNRKREY